MAFSAQVVARARRILEQRKEARQSENSARLQQVYARLPQVKEMDERMKGQLAQAARSAFLQGSDGREVMQQLKEQNLLLQAQRQKLIEEAFGPGYLDESPICPHCGGEGYLGSRMCSCLEAICRKEQKKELSLLACGEADFSQFRLDYYPDRIMPGSGVSIRSIMQKTFTDCKKYAEAFVPGSPNLLFSGDTGLGKTFLSACIACAVADKGYSVVYESAAHLFQKLEKAHFTQDEAASQAAAGIAGCDLLFIDDLGTEMGSQFVTSALYTLLNDRILAGKATVISTNLTVDQLEKRYSSQILSRLRGSYRRMAFVGDDIRILKNQGALV